MTRRALLLGTAFAGPWLSALWRLLDVRGVLAELELSHRGLGPVAEAFRAGDTREAADRLLAWYRSRSGVRLDSPWAPAPDHTAVERADRLLDEHVFDLGFGYPPQSYGACIQWDANPVGDIEWVAAMQRFYWQDALLAAYLLAGNGRYARGWVELTRDWIQKHPEVDPHRFEWLDIQVGLRAIRWCVAFETLRSAPELDSEFLLAFLSSIHAHARKSYLYAVARAHNKAVIEAVGLLYLGIVFPEFREAPRWRAKAWNLLRSAVELQVTREGVQREWTPSYHTLVASLLVDALWIAKLNGYRSPGILRAHAERMCDVWVAMTAPDGSPPMFGDTHGVRPARLSPATPLRPLQRASQIFRRPEWADLAEGRLSALRMPSRVFPASGMYFLRTGWGKQDVFLSFHCSPPAISGHDQPDNGTFELYAFQRWLMPDSGSFSYPETPYSSEREWFRRTAVHQTLTLDQANTHNRPRHLLWTVRPALQCLAFENQSYPDLIHRRTVFFFPTDRFFVLLDEALGSARGVVELHFQFAPGVLHVDSSRLLAFTGFQEGPNVLLCWPEGAPIALLMELGQYSERLNHKVRRPAIAVRHRDASPVWFLTLVVPYEGPRPEAEIRPLGELAPGQPRVQLEVQVAGRRWRAGRDLARRAAWCESV